MGEQKARLNQKAMRYQVTTFFEKLDRNKPGSGALEDKLVPRSARATKPSIPFQ